LISGPDPVFEQTPNSYEVTGAPGATFAWAISGNGVIVGSTMGSTVLVNSGLPGSFLLQVTVTVGSDHSTCSKSVSVVAVPPTPPGANANAKILLHVASPASQNLCQAPNYVPPCQNVRTSGSLSPAVHYAYLLIANGFTNGLVNSGLAGLQCGIHYDGAASAGVDVFSWTRCCDLEFSSTGWPNSGGGTILTWDATNHCQRFEPGGAGTGVAAVAGYFYLSAYSPDLMRVRPRPVDGMAKVASCQAQETLLEGAGYFPVPSPLGYAAFSAGGNVPGYSPCTTGTPVVHKTWSDIKTLFRP
jgi:hypothetical protein